MAGQGTKASFRGGGQVSPQAPSAPGSQAGGSGSRGQVSPQAPPAPTNAPILPGAGQVAPQAPPASPAPAPPPSSD